MRAALLSAPGAPLHVVEVPDPEPIDGEVLIRIAACGVCRTDLHIRDGELPDPRLPLVLGHEIVGRVEAVGAGVTSPAVGDRVGVPWLGWTCGECRSCVSGRENLCDRARFTGYTIDGGYAEFTVADARYCFSIPDAFDDVAAAPLLCAGLIGHRAYRMAGEAERIGLYGFGAAAHLLAQVAVADGREVFAFTRPGDAGTQAFARELGAAWSGGSEEAPPADLDAAIIFAPVGELVPVALGAVVKGGRVVCAGIHMSDIPSFPYRLLWEERCVLSVANLTREDGEAFLATAARIPLRSATEAFPLEEAEEALTMLRSGALTGAGVLTPGLPKP
jgi:propanol-preferring alcohol dehydrogenase